ncbi:MAG TPA: hypothetical protein VJH71_02005 [Candidatus Paceibacterota bacterium]
MLIWQIYGLWSSLAASLVGIILIVWKVEPQQATLLVRSLFFVAIFILIWSAVSLATFGIKSRLVKLRALSSAAYEPIFYDSFFVGLVGASAIMIFIFIKRFI